MHLPISGKGAGRHQDVEGAKLLVLGVLDGLGGLLQEVVVKRSTPCATTRLSRAARQPSVCGLRVHRVASAVLASTTPHMWGCSWSLSIDLLWVMIHAAAVRKYRVRRNSGKTRGGGQADQKKIPKP